MIAIFFMDPELYLDEPKTFVTWDGLYSYLAQRWAFSEAIFKSRVIKVSKDSHVFVSEAMVIKVVEM